MAHYAPQRARVCIDVYGVLTFRGPYIPALIAGFKSLPFRFRDYAPDDGKLWTIKPPYAEEALTLILRYAPDAEVEYSRQSRTHRTDAPPSGGNDYFATLHLRPTAPPELIDAAYRTLAKRFHPDRGGDTATMQQLNGAYAALRERVGA